MVPFRVVPRDVLGEILDLIESVSEGFTTYSPIQISILIKNSAEGYVAPGKGHVSMTYNYNSYS